LHFEIRKKYRSPKAWVNGWSESQVKEYYYDPSDFIECHRQLTSLNIGWEFNCSANTSGNEEGWAASNVENYSVNSGIFYIDPSASDPYIVSPPLSINASNYNAVRIRMASNAPDGKGNIYFITNDDFTWNEDKKVVFNVSNYSLSGSAPYFEYIGYMGNHPSWSGTITGLRIDPSDYGVSGPADTIGIDYIRLEQINRTAPYIDLYLNPNKGSFSAGDTQEKWIAASGGTGYSVHNYVRVTMPNGTKKFAYYSDYPGQPSEPLLFSDTKRPLYNGTWIVGDSSWNWNTYTFTGNEEIGFYLWEFWYEDTNWPDVNTPPYVLASDSESYVFSGFSFIDYLDANNPLKTHTIALPYDGELSLKITFDSTLSIKSVLIYDLNNSQLFGPPYPISGGVYGGYGLKAGTYYIKVTRSSGYGGYNLTTIYNAQPISNDSEPNDTFPEANPIPNSGDAPGHLGYTGGGNGSVDTVDNFKIILPSDGELKLKIIYDQTLGVNSIWINDLNNSQLFGPPYPISGIVYGGYGLKAGTYYIKVTRSSGYGGYNLTTIYNAQPIPNDSEPNDTCATAQPVLNNSNVLGHLGYTGGGNGATYTVDHFRFTFPANGQFGFKITFDLTLGVGSVSIYDTNCTLLYSKTYPSSGVIYGPYNLAAGIYSVKISRNSGYGGYVLQLQLPIIPPPPQTTFLIPFGSLNNGNINIGNKGGVTSNISINVLSSSGGIVKQQNTTIPPKGVKRSWDLIGNIFDYGEPLTVEISGDQLLIGDNIKWAAPPYDTVGAGFTCGSLSMAKGKLFYYPFSSFGQSQGYAVISNTTASTANMTIEVYDQTGTLKKNSPMTIGAKGVARTWETIGSIQAIADPALIRISSDQDVVVEAVRWEQNKRGWGFAIFPSSAGSGTSFLIPFGALNNGNINLANIAGTPANITLRVLNASGQNVKEQAFAIPAMGVKRTWDVVGNIYGYGKPATVEIISDQALVGDNIKWADPPYDTVGAGFTCGPLTMMKGRAFLFPFSAFGLSQGYAVISNTASNPANLTIEVYDQAGTLKKTSPMTIGAKGVARTWETIGSIQTIADPALIRITSDQDVVVEAVRWEQNKRGWGFAILPGL